MSQQRLQSIKDLLAEIVLATSPDDQAGKLARKALGQANAALLEYSVKPPLPPEVFWIDGLSYTRTEVRDVLDALLLATNTLFEIIVNPQDCSDKARNAYQQIVYTKENLNADQNRTT